QFDESTDATDTAQLDVRWLSRGKVLQRFLDLLPEIISFLKSRNEEYEQLSDDTRLLESSMLNAEMKEGEILPPTIHRLMKGYNKYLRPFFDSKETADTCSE
ncbi:hypothetical protein NQZ68_012559, partial [Dissostichus eleginoides]